MKTEQVTLVLAIAREGSVSKAAESLYISQPTASTMLKSLEAELGFAVFERKRTGMEPTTEGAEFIGYASGIERLVNAISQIKHPMKHIGFKALSLGFQFSEQAFGTLAEKYLSDSCVVDFTYKAVDRTEDALKLLEQGFGDVAVVMCRKSLYEAVNRNAAKMQLATVPIGNAHLELTCVEGHEIIRNGKIEYDLFGKYPCFSSVHKTAPEMYAPDFLIKHSVKIHNSIAMEPCPTRYELLQKTHGFLVSFPISEAIKDSYGFESLALEDADIAVFAVHRTNPTNADLIAKYIEYCTQLFPW